MPLDPQLCSWSFLSFTRIGIGPLHMLQYAIWPMLLCSHSYSLEAYILMPQSVNGLLGSVIPATSLRNTNSPYILSITAQDPSNSTSLCARLSELLSNAPSIPINSSLWRVIAFSRSDLFPFIISRRRGCRRVGIGSLQPRSASGSKV